MEERGTGQQRETFASSLTFTSEQPEELSAADVLFMLNMLE